MKNCGLVALNHVEPLWRGVRQLHGQHTGYAIHFVAWKRMDIAGNGQHQHGWSGTMRTVQFCRWITPLTFGIYRRRGIDADRDDVFIVVPRFERGEQDRCSASSTGIGFHPAQRARYALVIGHICDIESGVCVPCAIPLGREKSPPIPRVVCVTVKIHHDVIRIVHSERDHGARNHGTDCIDRDPYHQEGNGDAQLHPQRCPALACPNHAPKRQDEHHCNEEGNVLLERQKRQRIQQRVGRCQDRVTDRVDQRGISNSSVRFGIDDRISSNESCRYEQTSQENTCRNTCARKGPLGFHSR